MGFWIIDRQPGPSGARHKSAQQEMMPFVQLSDGLMAIDRLLLPRLAFAGHLGAFHLSEQH
jgi:hypothetical protein